MTKHAEHQCDEEKGGEGNARIWSVVNDVEHRCHGREKLPSSQARVWKPQIEAQPKDPEKRENERCHNRARIEKRLAGDAALRIKDGEHHQIQRRKGAGEQEPSQTEALPESVLRRR